MSIIAVGSLAFDSIKTPVGKKDRVLGGSLTHFSNAAYFLSRPKLIGVVGNDFTEKEWEFIRSKSEALDGVEVLLEEKSFFWEGYYSEDFDTAHTVKTELNAFAKFAPRLPENYKAKGDILFLANIDPVIQKQVALQCGHCHLKVLDTMNFWIQNAPDALAEAFDAVDAIVINEGEAFLLTGEKSILKAVEKLLKPHFQFIILKRGSNGVMVFGKDFIVSLPAYPVRKVIDPTGAGDSFAGAFMSYLDAKKVKKINREVVKKAAAYGTVVASFAIEDFGVDGINKAAKADIESRFREFEKIASF
jgi:sugar/nucleoside kinase (ribokinase family)